MTTRSVTSDSKSSITSVSKKSSAFKGHSRSLVSSASRDVAESRVSGDDENDDLLSDYTSETTFFDEGQQAPSTDLSTKEVWNFLFYKVDGKVHIFGEWLAKTKSYRYAVIGPDWPCVLLTYVVIIVPSIFVYLYLVYTTAEQIIFFIVFGLTIFGLTSVFVADPGLVRKYHHARTRHWTYCDHCESFRPPGTVHCSSCQVCVAGYDHHCPWTGKCIGHGNMLFFKIFVLSLSWLIILIIVLGILQLCDIK